MGSNKWITSGCFTHDVPWCKLEAVYTITSAGSSDPFILSWKQFKSKAMYCRNGRPERTRGANVENMLPYKNNVKEN